LTCGQGYASARLDVGEISHVPATRLDIAYDGTAFRGWAAQPGLRTVQGEFEAALATFLRREVTLSVAGRTDSGVHAWGQVASFEGAPPPGLARSLNGRLDTDVAVTAVSEAQNGFDARRDARSRTYCYRLLTRSVADPFERGRALWWPRPLDRDALEACAAVLPGTHDFTAFTPTETDHVRFERDVFRAEWLWEGELGAFWIEADAFMRKMVRGLVGTMLEVAGGHRTADEFAALLEGAPREQGGDTAAAHGLYLASVRY
jgi:tRNA pseudouridine38-40 synthase